jgi:hypothetical protein
MWRIALSLPLGQPRHFHMATYGLSWPTQGTNQDQVKHLVVTSFGPTKTSSHGTIRLVLARLRNWSPHVKDLVINCFRPTVTFSHGNMWILMVRLRNWLKLPARFISSLLIDFQSPSHTSSTTTFTSSRLVLHAIYWRGLVPIFPVLLCLLVHN